jgi:hypothetical protein
VGSAAAAIEALAVRNEQDQQWKRDITRSVIMICGDMEALEAARAVLGATGS